MAESAPKTGPTKRPCTDWADRAVQAMGLWSLKDYWRHRHGDIRWMTKPFLTATAIIDAHRPAGAPAIRRSTDRAKPGNKNAVGNKGGARPAVDLRQNTRIGPRTTGRGNIGMRKMANAAKDRSTWQLVPEHLPRNLSFQNNMFRARDEAETLAVRSERWADDPAEDCSMTKGRAHRPRALHRANGWSRPKPWRDLLAEESAARRPRQGGRRQHAFLRDRITEDLHERATKLAERFPSRKWALPPAAPQESSD